MINLKAAPRKIQGLLIFCLVGAVISFSTTFFVYMHSKNVTKEVGKKTAPSIVAAQNIKATLADAHSNAMNAMVTKEKPGGKFWTLYRKDLNSLHAQLVEASKNITYGEEEQKAIETISSNLSAYEYTVGGAVANGAEISVDQFMEANRLMQQKILPASTALNNVNLTQLDSTYNDYIKNIDRLISTMVGVGLVFLAILLGGQFYLFKKTRRIFNRGILLSAILLCTNLLYFTFSLYFVKGDLISAKQDAFENVNLLWNAKAVAYNAKSMESLYLLHNQTGIVQTADTINFNLYASRICSDPKAALSGGSFEGLLNYKVDNATFSSDTASSKKALEHWAKYVDIDKKVRNLEYDSKHAEAIALSVGVSEGQANNEFGKFDAALGETIKTNQENFDSNINSALKTLRIFPYILAVSLVAITAACILGLKPRMDEYKV